MVRRSRAAGARTITFGAYRKELKLFLVQADVTAETRGATGVKMVFSGRFSAPVNVMRTDTIWTNSVSSMRSNPDSQSPLSAVLGPRFDPVAEPVGYSLNQEMHSQFPCSNSLFYCVGNFDREGFAVDCALRHPPAVRLPDRNGSFPGLSEGVTHGFGCPRRGRLCGAARTFPPRRQIDTPRQ